MPLVLLCVGCAQGRTDVVCLLLHDCTEVVLRLGKNLVSVVLAGSRAAVIDTLQLPVPGWMLGSRQYWWPSQVVYREFDVAQMPPGVAKVAHVHLLQGSGVVCCLVMHDLLQACRAKWWWRQWWWRQLRTQSMAGQCGRFPVPHL
jgi:hypothetical protein